MNRDGIAKKLIALRGSKKQKEVAEDLGISQSALAMYERGQRIPRDEVKNSISKYYGVSVQDIFFENGAHFE